MTTMTFKKAGLLFLATFVVNIIFASNGFACKRSLEDEGDTYLTSKRPRIEYHQTPFLFSDIMHEIFSFMPFKDTANSRLTCKRWHEVHQSFLQDFVWGNTCNGLGRGLRCQFTISQLPKGHVQKALLDLHTKDGYVSLGLHTFPRSYLPVEFTPIQVGKVKQNIEMTEDFYDTVFSKSLLSHEAQEAALDHLLAACRFYFHQDDRDENIQIFFKNKKGRFIRHLKEQSDIQPYIDFENIPNDLTFISKVHNIVVIDTQLENKGYEKTFEDLLETNLDHRFILSIGEGKFVKDGTLSITSDDLDFLSSVNHLALVNPQGHITTIGKYFLSGCNITSFYTSGFTNVTTIRDGFLYGCNNLTSFDSSGLMNVTTIGYNTNNKKYLYITELM